MPKIAPELSAIEVRRLTKPGLHAVGGVPGLHLQVGASKSPEAGFPRSWVLRIKIGSKRRDMGLGSFGALTLAQAREKARHARQAVDAGRDPILEREVAASALAAKQASAITFAQAVPKAIAAKAGDWRNAKHKQQWENTLSTYAMPTLGPLLLDHITKDHIVSVLEPIWATKHETATRVRGRIEWVLTWAMSKGYRPEGRNPAALDLVGPSLTAPNKSTLNQHHKALPIDEVPAFLARLRARQGTSARALELAIFTAARSGEARGALWSEIDLDAATWTIPASRMKAKKEHRVALSQPALALLRALPRIEGTDLVFPGQSGKKPLSDMALTKVMRDMEIDAVPHGFRSTFRDWVAERTSYPGDLAEMALAHVIKNQVEAAYRRGDMLARRLQMMEAWAAFCETPAPAGRVVPLKAKKQA